MVINQKFPILYFCQTCGFADSEKLQGEGFLLKKKKKVANFQLLRFDRIDFDCFQIFFYNYKNV